MEEKYLLERSELTDKYSRLDNKFRKSVLKRLHLKKDATQSSVNAAILNFYRESGSESLIYLTLSQKEDPKFLTKLFEIRPILITKYNIPENIFKDHDFAMYYIKTLLFQQQKLDPQYDLEQLLKVKRFAFKDCLQDPDFTRKLADTFPDENIVKTVFYVFKRAFPDSQGQKYFEKAMKNLSAKQLAFQAKKFGSDCLKYLPKDHPLFAHLVGCGIEKDGFKSLCTLNVEDVLANKHLIILAYRKEGRAALEKYVKYDLSPVREIEYVDHNEFHSHSSYDPKYKQVQEALFGDQHISKLLEAGQLKILDQSQAQKSQKDIKTK